MKNLIFIVILCSFFTLQSAPKKSQIKVLIRCDDIGMCHAVNMATKQLIETGIVFSASVMFACPWYLEAVELLKVYPEISVGIHLTLNSEWNHLKWGPVIGKSKVPSLVDKNGYFFASEDEFAAVNNKLDEIEIELRAQIERALATGIKIDYMDFHMGSAVSTPKLRKLVEKLAKEYKLGMSGYFGEVSESLWHIDTKDKLPELFKIINNLKPDKVNLIVIHIGLETPEMSALIDMNNPDDPYRVSQHRQAELDALLSGKFEKAIKEKNIRLITYKDLIKKLGLKAMRRPEE